jgi:hypothetical protein
MGSTYGNVNICYYGDRFWVAHYTTDMALNLYNRYDIEL